MTVAKALSASNIRKGAKSAQRKRKETRKVASAKSVAVYLTHCMLDELETEKKDGTERTSNRI